MNFSCCIVIVQYNKRFLRYISKIKHISCSIEFKFLLNKESLNELTYREIFLLRVIFFLVIFIVLPLLAFIVYLGYLYFMLPEETCEIETDADGVTYEVCKTIIQETVYLVQRDLHRLQG